MLIPRRDYEVVDVWNVVGLRATGSNDLVIEDAFVPDYRTLDFPPTDDQKFPGHEVNDGLSYLIPQAQIFFRGLTTGPIGGLQSMLDHALRYVDGKVSARGNMTAKDPDVQLAVAEAVNGIDEMKTIMFRNYKTMMDAAARGEILSERERILMTYQSNHVPDRTLLLAKALFESTGGLEVFGRPARSNALIATLSLRGITPTASGGFGPATSAAS